MSNKEQYLKLWQQKRSELQVNTDQQAEWLAMHRLLDQQMPIVNKSSGHTNQASNLAKLSAHLAKFKLLYVAAALMTSAVTTYVVTQHRAVTKNNKPAKTEVRADSALINAMDTALINNPATDSVLQRNGLIDSSADKKTSANALKNNITNIIDENAVDENRNPLPGKTSARDDDSNKQVNILTQNAINGNANHLNRSRLGVNNSRLLLSANKTKNGLALTDKRVNRPYTGVSNSNNSNQSGSNTDQFNNRQLRQQATDYANRLNSGQLANNSIMDNTQQTDASLLQLLPSPLLFNNVPLLVNNSSITDMINKANTAKPNRGPAQLTPAKTKKDKTNANSILDWGILFGVNSNGSFTRKDQNKNIYGSLPVDAYAGLFATFNFSNKWAIDMQAKLLVPHSTGGGYNHIFATRNDTGQIVKQTYKITDSRKIYSAQMPLHLVYNITKNISIKAGPVINLPIKHFGASSFTALTDTIVDSIGYAGRLADTINRTTVRKLFSLGISGGVRFTYKRLRLEAVYYWGSQPYKISSPSGSYSSAVNNIQISLGFKLNQTKPDK